MTTEIVPMRSLGGYEMVAALGHVTGTTHWLMSGTNPSIDTLSDPEDVIGSGGAYAGQPAADAGEVVEILHPNGADNSSSTGIQQVRIYGLKTATSTEYESEIVELTGVATDSVSTWWRVVECNGVAFGSGNTNAGTVTLRNKTTTANIFGVMQVGTGRFQNAVWTTPYGSKTAIKNLLTSIVRPAVGTGNATMTIKIRPSGFSSYLSRTSYQLTTASPLSLFQQTPLVLRSGDDMIVECTTVSANTTTVLCMFDTFTLDHSSHA